MKKETEIPKLIKPHIQIQLFNRKLREACKMMVLYNRKANNKKNLKI
jgi:hypothetical protein